MVCMIASDLGTLLNSLTANDFEFFSSDGRGAIQGLGYIYRNAKKSALPVVPILVLS